MKWIKHIKLAGGRIIKTGVAIFITAWICVLLDWPPVFAVITAIVTVEPTVSDSIKKGIVRFPASAIGSAYAVLFISLFGNSPLTYTLAAVFTITTCVRLNLHAGVLVATLTSVAMVEVIHSNFLMSFFIRLGTTTTGLVVSTVVNLFMLPPDYTKEIAGRLQTLAYKTGIAIEKVVNDILDEEPNVTVVEQEMADRVDDFIHQTEELIRYQKEESKYHPLTRNEWQHFQAEQFDLRRLQLIHYHIGNLIHTSFANLELTDDKKIAIRNAAIKVAASLKDPHLYDQKEHKERLQQLTELFWDHNEEITIKKQQHPTSFRPVLIMLYELVSIYNLVERYYKTKSQ
ncbi:aromatic acid exporter family protein [Lentibacillus cibarius]|uniref:aromatic acid exporter family protein n=1 Tax=Lentibacillus cibarius TaxID=2583219 RepID=UPI00163DB3C1|nr:aromatic acid exporter family protein [Lentibacillus cibarius]